MRTKRKGGVTRHKKAKQQSGLEEEVCYTWQTCPGLMRLINQSSACVDTDREEMQGKTREKQRQSREESKAVSRELSLHNDMPLSVPLQHPPVVFLKGVQFKAKGIIDKDWACIELLCCLNMSIAHSQTSRCLLHCLHEHSHYHDAVTNEWATESQLGKDFQKHYLSRDQFCV